MANSFFPFLFRKEIEDQYIQENFNRIGEFFKLWPLTRSGFVFREYAIDGALTDQPIPHRLSYIPKDIIITHNLNNVAVDFDYLAFDKENIVISTSGPTTLRMFLGRYE